MEGKIEHKKSLLEQARESHITIVPRDLTIEDFDKLLSDVNKVKPSPEYYIPAVVIPALSIEEIAAMLESKKEYVITGGLESVKAAQERIEEAKQFIK